VFVLCGRCGLSLCVLFNLLRLFNVVCVCCVDGAVYPKNNYFAIKYFPLDPSCRPSDVNYVDCDHEPSYEPDSSWASRDGLTQSDGVFKWETGGKDVFYTGAGETVDIAFPTESNQ
jgi:hypothetical protein